MQNVFRFIAQAEDKELQNWLVRFLYFDKLLSPPLPVPDSYSSGATYLVSRLSQMQDLESAQHIFRAAFRVLASATHSAQRDPKLVDDLLFLMEGLACPEENKEEVIDLLDQMRKGGEYRDWPSTADPIHPQILLTIAHLVGNGRSKKGWDYWEDALKGDLVDLNSSVSALSILVNIDTHKAVSNHLVNVLGVLRQGGSTPSNLMFGLAWMSQERPVLRKEIERILKEADRTETLTQFHESLDNLSG